MKFKKLFILIYVFCSLPTLTSCIVAALALGGSSVAYIDGSYSMNVSSNMQETYNATVKIIKQNTEYTFVSMTFNKDESIVKATLKRDSSSVEIKLTKLTQDATKINIRIGTFGNSEQSNKLMNMIEKSLGLQQDG